jgi:AcrR family transcriptional regulator
VAIAPREDGRREIGGGPRERILRSMVGSVGLQGYASADVSEVIERAEVTPATFDRLFAGKDDCVLAAYDWVIERILERVATAYDLGAAASWSEGVRRGLEALLEAIAEQPVVARMVLVEVPSISPDAHARYRTALDRLASMLTGGREYLGEDEEPPPQVELMALGGAEVILVDEVSAGRSDQLPARMPEILFAILVPYLGPEDAAAEMHAAAAA